MPHYHFERESRTSHSESFVIYSDEKELGRVDIHYATDVTRATVCLPEDTSEDDIQDVIGEVDERLVMTADPFREDFVVTVWIGRQAGVYSEDFDDELLEDIEEDVEGNGHKD